jgi:OmpA-OmpF porin, OOP family
MSNRRRTERIVISWVLPLVGFGLICGVTTAQTVQVRGVINGRNGANMTLQTAENPSLVVVLTDNTNVDDVEGILHARKKEMALSALIPGLPVQVQGSYNAQNQLVADSVKFKGNDLKAAEDAQAGLRPAEQQLTAQQAQLTAQQAQLTAEQQKVAANKAAIAADNKRFGELAEYNILGETTVYFGNGQVSVEPQYTAPLLQLAEKAKTITAYIIQVQGYASKVGSAALNQKLSQERAANVLDLLEQQGSIPLTNVLAPGAMGTSQQVAPDTSVEGQAENRRVVVRILQNKGIAGT